MTGCGTVEFAAPEIFKPSRLLRILPFKPDIYSFGLIAAWMMNTKSAIDT